jgi:hypothetical protein
LDILESNNDLSQINLNSYINKILMKELITFTKLCNNCVLQKCTGGYNCKYGACLTKYHICYDDLNYNNCNDINCQKIHLTKRNLKPIYNKIYYYMNNKTKILINNLNDEFKPNHILDSILKMIDNSNNSNNSNNTNNSNNSNNSNNLKNNVCQDDNYVNNHNDYINDYDSNDSNDSNDIDINYINDVDINNNIYDDDSDSNCEKSIFDKN